MTPIRPGTFSIFVRFRNTRLTMARRIAGQDEALRRAEALRSQRQHHPDAIFVVDDATGETVERPGLVVASPAAVAPPTDVPRRAALAPAAGVAPWLVSFDFDAARAGDALPIDLLPGARPAQTRSAWLRALVRQQADDSQGLAERAAMARRQARDASSQLTEVLARWKLAVGR